MKPDRVRVRKKVGVGYKEPEVRVVKRKKTYLVGIDGAEFRNEAFSRWDDPGIHNLLGVKLSQLKEALRA